MAKFDIVWNHIQKAESDGGKLAHSYDRGDECGYLHKVRGGERFYKPGNAVESRDVDKNGESFGGVKMGICVDTWFNYKKQNTTISAFKSASKDEMKQIFKQEYYDKFFADLIDDDDLRIRFVDFPFNAGYPVRHNNWIKKALTANLNESADTLDWGKYGQTLKPSTVLRINELSKKNPTLVFNAFWDATYSYYKSIKKYGFENIRNRLELPKGQLRKPENSICSVSNNPNQSLNRTVQDVYFSKMEDNQTDTAPDSCRIPESDTGAKRIYNDYINGFKSGKYFFKNADARIDFLKSFLPTALLITLSVILIRKK